MARDRNTSELSFAPVRRILVAVLVAFMVIVFLVWRIDSPRVERLRAQVIDSTVPVFSWITTPLTQGARMLDDFQSYARIYEQNQELLFIYSCV